MGLPRDSTRSPTGALRAAAYALGVLALVAASCSGGAAPTQEATAPSGRSSAVPENLELLGDLIAVHSPAVTVTIDGSATTIPLAGDASLVVPTGSVPGPTEITVTIFDVRLDRFVLDPPEAHVYVLAADRDLSLSAPLVLEIPTAPGSQRAAELVNGSWIPIPLGPGPTVRIEIHHFSERTLLVADHTPEPMELRPDVGPAEGARTSDAMLGCLRALTVFSEGEDGSVPTVVLELAYRVCTEALVNVLTPMGSKVEVACVGEEIGGGTTIEQAIERCADGQPGTGAGAGATSGERSEWIEAATARLTSGLDPSQAAPYREHLQWCLPSAARAGLSPEESEADCELPWTFEGSGLESGSNTTSYGPVGKNSVAWQDEPFEVSLTLNPDGTIQGALTFPRGIRGGACGNPAEGIRGLRERIDLDPPVVVPYVGTWSPGSFAIMRNPDDPDPISGTYDALSMSGLSERAVSATDDCGQVEFRQTRTFSIERVD